MKYMISHTLTIFLDSKVEADNEDEAKEKVKAIANQIMEQVNHDDISSTDHEVYEEDEYYENT